MGAIGISIGHDDDLAIVGIFDIEILPNAGADRLNKRGKFEVFEASVPS
jgi:hypothetical protein